jgi:hypothetical protein
MCVCVRAPEQGILYSLPCSLARADRLAVCVCVRAPEQTHTHTHTLTLFGSAVRARVCVRARAWVCACVCVCVCLAYIREYYVWDLCICSGFLRLSGLLRSGCYVRVCYVRENYVAPINLPRFFNNNNLLFTAQRQCPKFGFLQQRPNPLSRLQWRSRCRLPRQRQSRQSLLPCFHVISAIDPSPKLHTCGAISSPIRTRNLTNARFAVGVSSRFSF